MLSHGASPQWRTGPVFKYSYSFPLGLYLLMPPQISSTVFPKKMKIEINTSMGKNSMKVDTKHNSKSNITSLLLAEITEII